VTGEQEETNKAIWRWWKRLKWQGERSRKSEQGHPPTDHMFL